MKLLSFFVCAMTLASTIMGDALIFDFGPEESPLREGALRVTEAGGKKAVWSSSDNLKSRKNEKMPTRVYQNELICDHLSSSEPNTLKLDVPAGSYQILLLCGRSGGKSSQVWDISISDGRTEKSATFAGACELRKLQFDTVAKEQGIELNFTTRGRWLVNTIIVVPEATRESAWSGLLNPLLRDCFTLPPEEMSKWTERPMPCALPEPRWTEKQKKDGIAVFSRPWTEPVWPEHYPRQHELNAPIRAFAAMNEYEPLTFTLHALKDFENISIKSISLTNTRAKRDFSITPDNIELRFVRYMYVRPNYNVYNTYYRAPDILTPWKPRSLAKGENLRLWITVKTGNRQPAGIYKGEISLSADQLSLSVPISLRVLPITLQKDQSLVYGMYYRHPFDNLKPDSDDFSRAWWQHKAESEHVDMREHGINTVVLTLGGYWKNDRWHYHFDQLQQKIDLYRKVGFDKPIVCHFPTWSLYHKYMKTGMGSHLSQVKMPPDEFFTELTDMVRGIENEARRRQWPELLYYPVDEPSTAPITVEFMTRAMAAIKKVAGARTYVTADPEHEQFAPMRPYVDVWCCQPFSLGRKAVLDDMKKRDVEYWCYPNHIAGENDHTPTIGARMTYGFGLWESGYRALIPWIYQYSGGDPWNNLDSSMQDFFNRTSDDGSPLAATLWEAYREGIDDHRYVVTLQNAIARAREIGDKEAADSAQKTLDKIFKSIEVQPKYKNEKLWDAATFNAWRWAIAEQIMLLQ